MKERFHLSGNFLKIIAAISMLIDHVGLMFFPHYEIFRILGRIALPIFAFMIAEGCRYTRNKLRYFLGIFTLAFICQTVYFIYDGDLYMSILVTFSISILNIYALQFFKKSVYSNAWQQKKILSALLFIFAVVATYLLNQFLEIDYGFYGCMLPVFPALLHPVSKNNNNNKSDRLIYSVLALCVGMVLLSLDLGYNQFWSFLALPFLLMYSGKRGKANIKYFFYIFYPAHLLLLEAINLII